MSGTANKAATDSSPKSPPSALHSSAAFLHQLHNGPSSHHITLAATPTARKPNTGMKAAQPLGAPIEPVELEPKAVPPRSASIATSSQIEQEAGSTGKRQRRGRKRPSTAPIPGDDNILTPSAFSPESDYQPLEDGYESSSSTTSLPQIMSGDACTTFLSEEYGEHEALEGMAAAGGSQTPSSSVIVGHSGTPSGQSGADAFPPAPQTGSGAISPTEKLSWKTFARSYAHGLFDPNRIPDPPLGMDSAPDSLSESVQSSPRTRYTNSQAMAMRRSETHLPKSQSVGPPHRSVPSTSVAPSVAHKANLDIASKMQALELENMDKRRMGSLKPDKLALPSYSFAAATVRMAASSLREPDLSPFGVPSPERELTDPMASIVTASVGKEGPSSDPGSSRLHLGRSMSNSNYSVHAHGQAFLPPIAASPVSTPSEHSQPRTRYNAHASSPPSAASMAPRGLHPATAPVEKVVESEEVGDYFGHFGDIASQGSSATPTARKTATVSRARSSTFSQKPLPEDDEYTLPGIAQPRDVGPLYDKLGWMPAPIPPYELERRKALYRFGILNTAKDVNFDRIAHMVKLVFNTRIVLIALTDSTTQWHKAQAGPGLTDEAKRINSFCSHTILSESEEPFVVLDSHLDWRFEKNPNVVSGPKIRFYAGAPLRTAEGYNIGSVCIIDDKPRTEFPPRQRMILKEFAAVTMREMELWRDKLQLRVRDRIQHSMEVFTRECLELDANTLSSTAKTSRMDHVYARAAQLVRSTLDLDGCFLLDTSKFEMTEIQTDHGVQTVFRADPYVSETQSPVLERSDEFGPVESFPVLGSTLEKVPTRPLTGAEHEKLSDFLRDHRDGRIFENVAPSWIRYMFPSSLQYGMGECNALKLRLR